MVFGVEILLLSVLGYLGLGVSYWFLFSFFSLFHKDEHFKQASAKSNIGVLIPGYKEDAVILETAKSALEQQYPTASFDVIVLADSFSSEVLSKLRDLDIVVWEVSFEQSSKARSINAFLRENDKKYDFLLVLDADNIMADGVLETMNNAYHSGAKSIHCHRVAKNEDTHTSLLDGLADEINNSIWRKGHSAVGLSCAVGGSGMAIDYDIFKNSMSEIDVFSGFDKELEVQLLLRGVKTIYIDNALIFDEKVRKSKALRKQRARWFASQLNVARKYYSLGLNKMLKEGNFELLNKTFQFILLPRAFTFTLLILLTVLSRGIGNQLSFEVGAIMLGFFILSMLFSTPRTYFNLSTLKALTHLPSVLLALIGSLFHLREAKTKFLNTEHEGSES